jgi:hypothetical protein
MLRYRLLRTRLSHEDLSSHCSIDQHATGLKAGEKRLARVRPALVGGSTVGPTTI